MPAIVLRHGPRLDSSFMNGLSPSRGFSPCHCRGRGRASRPVPTRAGSKDARWYAASLADREAPPGRAQAKEPGTALREPREPVAYTELATPDSLAAYSAPGPERSEAAIAACSQPKDGGDVRLRLSAAYAPPSATDWSAERRPGLGRRARAQQQTPRHAQPDAASPRSTAPRSTLRSAPTEPEPPPRHRTAVSTRPRSRLPAARPSPRQGAPADAPQQQGAGAGPLSRESPRSAPRAPSHAAPDRAQPSPAHAAAHQGSPHLQRRGEAGCVRTRSRRTRCETFAGDA